MTEAAEAAPAYEASGYVATDELDAAVNSEWYCDEWARLIRRAKLRKIRLHDIRHTTLSLMEKAGVPVSVISAWAGHYSAAFTMATYVHGEAEDLAEGRDALRLIYGSGEPSRGRCALPSS
jgi:integrase